MDYFCLIVLRCFYFCRDRERYQREKKPTNTEENEFVLMVFATMSSSLTVTMQEIYSKRNLYELLLIRLYGYFLSLFYYNTIKFICHDENEANEIFLFYNVLYFFFVHDAGHWIREKKQQQQQLKCIISLRLHILLHEIV